MDRLQSRSNMSIQPTPIRSRSPAWLSFGGLLLVLAAVIAAGYLGFRAFASVPDQSEFDLYLLAIIAGVASFFSPCAFPLLPSYLSFYYQAEQKDEAHRPGASQALKLGLAAALGVISFTMILGIVIGILGTGVGQSLSISGPEPSQFVRVFRGLVGVVLVSLGVAQLKGWNRKPKFVDAFVYRTRPQREGSRGPATNLYLYGLGYNAAGIGCTGPILAGLTVFALASGGFTSALAAFAIFALTMGTLMLVISGLVGASRLTLVNRMKAAAPRIKQVASILLIAVGLFNLFTALNLNLFVRIFFP